MARDALRDGPSLRVAIPDRCEEGLTLWLWWPLRPAPPGGEAGLRKASQAGIRTIMVTGDHKTTARAIGLELGLWRPQVRSSPATIWIPSVTGNWPCICGGERLAVCPRTCPDRPAEGMAMVAMTGDERRAGGGGGRCGVIWPNRHRC